MWLAVVEAAYAEEAVLTAASCGSTSEKATLFDVAITTTADGTAWAAAVHADITTEPDHLGNAYRWDPGICLSRRGPEGWSAPVILKDEEIRVAPGGLRIVAAPDGDLWVVYSGDHVSPKADGPVPPGTYDVRLVRVGPDGISTPESLVDSHPRLLHGFDLAFAPDGAAHFVWAPWPEKTTDEHLFYRVLEASAWSTPVALPLHDGRNSTQPVLMFDGNVPVVSAHAQTPDYANIVVVSWRRERTGWVDTRLGPAVSFSLDGGPIAVWHVETGLLTWDIRKGREIRILPTLTRYRFAADGSRVVVSDGITVWAVADRGDPVRMASGEIVGHLGVAARSGLAIYTTGTAERADTLMAVPLPR